MTRLDELVASLAVDTPSTGERVRFRILPEATGRVSCRAGFGGKLAVVLDGTGETVYVDDSDVERMVAE